MYNLCRNTSHINIGYYFHCDKSNEYCYNKLLCQTIPNQKNQVLSAFDLSAFRNQES